MSLLKNIAKAALGTAGKIVSNSGLPGANAVGNVLQAVGASKSTVKATTTTATKSTGKISNTSTSPVVPSKSNSGGSTSSGWISKKWNQLIGYLKGLKEKNMFLFILLVVVAPIVLVLLVWLVIRVIKRGRKKTSFRSRRKSRAEKTATSNSPIRSGKRKASPAQLAALARGRAKRKRNISKR